MGMNLDSGDSKKGRHRPEMNVTPLVDVVLVLLIIFMVAMPAMQEFFWLYVPPRPAENAAPPPSDQQQPLVVTVNDVGEIRINRDVYDDADFPESLRRMLVARGDRKVYFDAADTAPFGRAVQVMDLARSAGAAHIAVMTERLR